MKLNLEQSKHLAATSRIISIGLFGLFGYPFLSGNGGSLVLLLVALALSVAFEVFAIYLLAENYDE